MGQPPPSDDRPRVFLGMPHYDAITSGAMVGWMAATYGHVILPFGPGAVGSSFLCGAFNDLWCFAMNHRDAGNITHFAMIHADVEPEIGWLDLLAKELHDRELTVLSAIIPIKKDKDLEPDTPMSTGLGNRHDPWGDNNLFRRSSRETMPPTITPADVCGPNDVLLINTGLWIADLRHPAWDRFPGFNVHARVRKGPKGWVAAQRTEDWEFARWLDSEGVPYGATWLVEVGHKGGGLWRNR